VIAAKRRHAIWQSSRNGNAGNAVAKTDVIA